MDPAVPHERIGHKAVASDAVRGMQSISASRTPMAFDGLSIPKH